MLLAVGLALGSCAPAYGAEPHAAGGLDAASSAAHPGLGQWEGGTRNRPPVMIMGFRIRNSRFSGSSPAFLRMSSGTPVNIETGPYLSWSWNNCVSGSIKSVRYLPLKSSGAHMEIPTLWMVGSRATMIHGISADRNAFPRLAANHVASLSHSYPRLIAWNFPFSAWISSHCSLLVTTHAQTHPLR